MNRREVIARLQSVEPALRARGIASLYLFGSHGRDEATPASDIDVFVDAGSESFYRFRNFMGAYDDLVQAFPGVEIGYSTREGLFKDVRPFIERETIRIF